MTTTQDSLQYSMQCPMCSRTFHLGSEEYCTYDGERLQIKLSDPVVAATEAPPVQAVQPIEPRPQHAELTPLTSSPEFPEAPPQSSPTESVLEQKMAAAAPQAACEPGPDLGMLGNLFAQFGIRRKAPPHEQANGYVAASSPCLEDTDTPLPASMVDAGWVISGAPRSDEFGDTWAVQRKGVQALYSRYRCRVLTRPDLYRQLQQQSKHVKALPSVLEAGTVNLRGHAQASYDLTVLPATHGGSLQRLDEWLRLAPPSEQKATALLPALADLLDELHTLGVAPILLQPSQILRHDSGRLMLGHVAALTATGTDAAVQEEYRPELECNPLVSRLWAAPEIHEQLVVHPSKAAVFSVGQLLAAATWGQPLDLAALRSGKVPLHTLQDSRLARVLQGCLWAQHIEGRWCREQLHEALKAAPDALPAAEDWASLGPQAMGVAFPLNGRTYWRVSDLMLAAVLPTNWPHATARLAMMLDWVEASSWASAVPALRALLAQGHSEDHVLIRMVRQICPNVPLTWRDICLDDHSARQSLIHLAQTALAEDASPAERQRLRDLFRADLRGAFNGA